MKDLIDRERALDAIDAELERKEAIHEICDGLIEAWEILERMPSAEQKLYKLEFTPMLMWCVWYGDGAEIRRAMFTSKEDACMFAKIVGREISPFQWVVMVEN